MNVRRVALDALIDITERGAYANLRLKALPEAFTLQERKRVSALVYTALDHLLYIDWLLQSFISGSQKPPIRGILRLGVSELLYFHTPVHAVVSEYVSLTRAIGKPALTGFVNAVLRNVGRAVASGELPALPSDPCERLSIQFSYPRWLVSEWIAQYGEAFTTALLSAQPSGVGVRAQYPFRSDELLAALPVAATRGRLDENCLILNEGFDVTALPEYQSGRMTVQGQSAMLACRALGDCTGKRVLDACAAPGGKSAYLASLWKNDLQLTCMELHPHRKELLDKTLARLHVDAVTLCQDASEPVAAFNGAFDAVLLDAPCSGLGLLNDKPDIRYAKTDGDLASLAAIQRVLLDVCSGYVAPGGVLLYATCTISRRENEENVQTFLAGHAEFFLEAMPVPLENNGMMQLFPHLHGTDGFFIARMKRCI